MESTIEEQQAIQISWLSLFLVRISDVILSLFGLVFLSPILILIIILVKTERKGDILFVQDRVGKDQTTFKMYKFRSMVKSNSFSGDVNLDEFNKLSDEEKQKKRNEYQTTSSNDSRITKIGFFLRKTSLDELPQLINVLKGDMSLVGPRPDAPVQAIDYKSEDWRQRCLIRPGITGMSQVYGRSNCTIEQRIRNDLFYLKNHSYVLYVKIILKTFVSLMEINKVN